MLGYMSPFHPTASSPQSTAETWTCSSAPSFGSILRLSLLKWEIDLHNSEWVFLHYAGSPISTPENPASCCTAFSSASLSGLHPMPSQLKKKNHQCLIANKVEQHIPLLISTPPYLEQTQSHLDSQQGVRICWPCWHATALLIHLNLLVHCRPGFKATVRP